MRLKYANELDGNQASDKLSFSGSIHVQKLPAGNHQYIKTI